MKNPDFSLTRYLWIPLFTGLIAIGLGIWCFCSPVSSIPVMAYIFAGFMCLAGVFNIAFSFINRGLSPHWGWSLAFGLLDLVAGVWMFCLPAPEIAVTFVIVLGIWLVCVAINAICETMVLSSGSIFWTVLSILLLVCTIYFAVVVVSSPVTMAVAGWFYLGFSLLAFGCYRIAMYCKLRRLSRTF